MSQVVNSYIPKTLQEKISRELFKFATEVEAPEWAETDLDEYSKYQIGLVKQVAAEIIIIMKEHK